MRIRAALAFLTLLVAALAPAGLAAAQSGNTASNPFPLAIAVDSTGFVAESSWNVTAGDWANITVSNDDEVAHTVTISGLGLTFSVQAVGEQSRVVQLSRPGSFGVSDAPSGDSGTLTVVNGDVVDYENHLIDANGKAVSSGSGITATTGSGRVPGFELPLLAIALAAAALTRRR